MPLQWITSGKLCQRIYANFPEKYSSTQKLIVELGIGFDRKIESSFIGTPRECHKNAFDVLMEYPKPELYYCIIFRNDIK
jgi:hypothetical protein